MYQEIHESPERIHLQIQENQEWIRDYVKITRALDPSHLITVARGSSDHAAHFLSYLAMNECGLLPTSLSMSIITHYQASLKCQDSLVVAVSQSGQSPDILEPMRYFESRAKSCLSLVNEKDSPLAQQSQNFLALRAGKEKSVAATKSYLCTLSAAVQLFAEYSNNKDLLKKLFELPSFLEKSLNENWDRAQEVLINKNKLFVSGRGFGLSLAFEAALKFKETCAIQAEGFSSAEIKHGPQALIKENYPLLVFATPGPTQKGLLELSKEMKERGAQVLLAAPENIKERDLTIISTGDPALDILTTSISFYLMVEKLSRSLKLDPDRPHYLAKVTLTK